MAKQFNIFNEEIDKKERKNVVIIYTRNTELFDSCHKINELKN